MDEVCTLTRPQLLNQRYVERSTIFPFLIEPSPRSLNRNLKLTHFRSIVPKKEGYMTNSFLHFKTNSKNRKSGSH